jgi:hypothetical protein
LGGGLDRCIRAAMDRMAGLGAERTAVEVRRTLQLLRMGVRVLGGSDSLLSESIS